MFETKHYHDLVTNVTCFSVNNVGWLASWLSLGTARLIFIIYTVETGVISQNNWENFFRIFSISNILWFDNSQSSSQRRIYVAYAQVIHLWWLSRLSLDRQTYAHANFCSSCFPTCAMTLMNNDLFKWALRQSFL